jgi:hypothetical protein
VVFFGKYIAVIVPSFIIVCHCPLNKLTDTFSHYDRLIFFSESHSKARGTGKTRRINDGVISVERCTLKGEVAGFLETLVPDYVASFKRNMILIHIRYLRFS